MRQVCAGRTDNICTDTVISITERAANEKGRLSNQKVMNERIKNCIFYIKFAITFLEMQIKCGGKLLSYTSLMKTLPQDMKLLQS